MERKVMREIAGKFVDVTYWRKKKGKGKNKNTT
jgi:hypothetical protein